MKSHLSVSAHCLLAFCAALAGLAVPALGAQSKPNVAPGSAVTNSVAPQMIPQSIFTIPASAKEGRNPFFPQSTQPLPPTPKTKEATLDITASFVLNGITSPPKPTAMINGRTFESGESGEVKLPSGSKVIIKCEEIKSDSALILVDGQRRELRLRFGL